MAEKETPGQKAAGAALEAAGDTGGLDIPGFGGEYGGKPHWEDSGDGGGYPGSEHWNTWYWGYELKIGMIIQKDKEGSGNWATIQELPFDGNQDDVVALFDDDTRRTMSAEQQVAVNGTGPVTYGLTWVFAYELKVGMNVWSTKYKSRTNTGTWRIIDWSGINPDESGTWMTITRVRDDSKVVEPKPTEVVVDGKTYIKDADGTLHPKLTEVVVDGKTYTKDADGTLRPKPEPKPKTITVSLSEGPDITYKRSQQVKIKTDQAHPPAHPAVDLTPATPIPVNDSPSPEDAAGYEIAAGDMIAGGGGEL